MLEKETRILLIGCGVMGGALLRGWLSSLSSSARFDVVSPRKESLHSFLEDSRVSYFRSPESVLSARGDDSPNVIFYAAKPHRVKDILPSYSSLISEKSLFVSVAAGKTFSDYESVLDKRVPMVRLMPNTPAAIGRGVSLLVSKFISSGQMNLITQLANALGKSFWLPNEDDFDKATLLSGCGPAYLFTFIDALEKAGQALGLSMNLSRDLAVEMLAGSLDFYQSHSKSASALSQDVASPGGVTEAALEVLKSKESGLYFLLNSALQQGYQRSLELKQKGVHEAS